MAQSIHITTLRKMLKAGDPSTSSCGRKAVKYKSGGTACRFAIISIKARSSSSCSILGKFARHEFAAFSLSIISKYSYNEIATICNFLYLLLRLMTKQEV